MAGRVAAAVLAATAVAWLAAAPAAAQVTAPNNANCTADDASITCTWSQPASSPITQYRCTWHARGVARSFVKAYSKVQL